MADIKRMQPHPDYTCNGCGKKGYKITECFDCNKKGSSNRGRSGSSGNYGRD